MKRMRKDVEVPLQQLYKAKDSGKDPYLKQLKQGVKAPEELLLKIDTQVMLLKNIEVGAGLVK